MMKMFTLFLLIFPFLALSAPLSAQSDQSTQSSQQQSAPNNQQQSAPSNQQQGAQPKQQPKPAMHFERGFGAGSNVVNSANGVAGGGRTN
jgi:hypothetical protein